MKIVMLCTISYGSVELEGRRRLYVRVLPVSDGHFSEGSSLLQWEKKYIEAEREGLSPH